MQPLYLLPENPYFCTQRSTPLQRMAHHHDHHHGHHHHHGLPPEDSLTRAFLLGIGLNLLFVVIEVIAGFQTGSLALLSDAGHNLSDVASLALSLFAFRLAKLGANRYFSYGYRRSTILASLANGLLLMIAICGLGLEAVRRLSEPAAVPGVTVAAVAFAGILINGFTAWLFHRDRDKDLNIKGAYLHLAADAAVSAGVVVAGALLHYTGWGWIDPAITFVILGVIFWSTWGLLRDSIRLSLDGVPPHVDLELIKKEALAIPGVRDIHHIHVWALSTTETALTAHLVMEDQFTPADLKKAKATLRHALEHLQIQHVTLEIECESEGCKAVSC
jgi:cobalt-zinc-cadmium efflux system protein